MIKTVGLNITRIPKELKLILEIIKVENADRISEEWRDDIDWDLFLQLAFHHRLYPLLYSKLLNMENSWIPSKTLESLAQSYQKNTFHMLHLTREMGQLNQLFMKNEIRPLFLKGPVLSIDLYGDLSKRTCGDLDILVPLEDLDKIDGLLVDEGYEKDDYIKTLLNDWKWRHHHFTYFHPTHGTKVEIHWRLNPAPSKEPTFNELWKNRRQSMISNLPVYFLGKEDLFFFLVTHGARHGWSRLRWLVDIHQIMNNDLNNDLVYKQFKKYQCQKLCGQSLILSSQLLNTDLSESFNRLTANKQAKRLAQEAMFYLESMINLHTDPVPSEVGRFHANHLFSQMSFQQKLVYFLSVLHPYYTDLETLPLPKKLHFLYFPLRPFLWAWRKTREHA